MSVTPKSDKKFRTHDARFAADGLRRATRAEISIMKCHACGHRPHISISDYALSQGPEHWLMECNCPNKRQWFRVIDF